MENFNPTLWLFILVNFLLWTMVFACQFTEKFYSVTYEYRGEHGKIFREMAVVNTVLGQNPKARAKRKLPVKIKIFEPDFSGFEIVEIRKIEVL